MQLEPLEISPLPSSSEVTLAASISALKQSYTLWTPLRFLKQRYKVILKVPVKGLLRCLVFKLHPPLLQSIVLSALCWPSFQKNPTWDMGGVESWFFCHIFALFCIGGIHRTHKAQRAFLLFAEYPVISMALSKTIFSSWSCSVWPFTGYASDLDEKLFFRTISSAGPGWSMWTNAGGCILHECIAVAGLYGSKREHKKRTGNDDSLVSPLQEHRGRTQHFPDKQMRCFLT